MNRVAVWILGTISGVVLAYSCLMLTMSSGYGVGGGCAYAAGASPCTPQIQEMTVTLPTSNMFLAPAITFLLLAVLIGLPAWIASPILAERRGAAGKTPILVLSILASALLIVGVVSVFFSPAFSTPQTCFNPGGFGAGDANQTCVTGAQAHWLAALAIVSGIWLAALAINLPAWTMALVRTARRHSWGWLIVIVLLSPFATVLYGFLGDRHATTPTTITPLTAPAGSVADVASAPA